MFENPRRGKQAINFTINVLEFLDLKWSSKQIFSENWRWVPLTLRKLLLAASYNSNYCKKDHIHLIINIMKEIQTRILIIPFLFSTLWLYDWWLVKVFKTLNDRQSCLFSNFTNQKNPANLNYHMSIKKSQAILERLTDLKFSVWFTLGSENESMFCDTSTFFRWTAGQAKVCKTLSDQQSYIFSLYSMTTWEISAICLA